MTLFGRVVAVEVGAPGALARRLEGLRVRWTAHKSLTGAADPATVTVWNPADQTLGAIAAPGAVTRILAGYQRASQVASGTVVPGSLRVERSMGDRTATWQVQDGGRDYTGTDLAISWSRTTAREVIDAVAGVTSLAVGSIELARSVDYVRGYIAAGSLADVLSDVCDDAGSQWVVQDGALRVWPIGEPRKVRAEVIEPRTGLIGEVQATDTGVGVRCLLRPAMRPGDAIRLRSTDYDGDYLVRDVTHTGDSGYDAAFYTEAQAVPRGD